MDTKSNSKKEYPVEQILESLIKGIGSLFTNAFYGAKKLNRARPLIGLAVTVVVSILAYHNRQSIFEMETLFEQNLPVFMRYILYWFLLVIPVFYLAALGSATTSRMKKYESIFLDIGFTGKNKRVPMLVKQWTEEPKTFYLFRSNIPLSEWQKAEERLENGFDLSIRKIEDGGNKKTVKLVTVANGYKMPEMIPFEKKHIKEVDNIYCLGIDEDSLEELVIDIDKTPHYILAGETNSGKSVLMRCILWQMINQGCKVYMMDFKGGVEFGKAYEHYGQVVIELEDSLPILMYLVKETKQRFKLFRDMEVKNLADYNKKTKSNLCRVGLFIDELGQMLDKKGASKKQREFFEQVEWALSTIARQSRAVGIHMFLGVQRPDANVLTGQIKSNIPGRISGRFADKSTSEIVLGNTMACELPEIKGRLLYKSGNATMVFQGYYFDDDEHLYNENRKLIDPAKKPGDMLIRSMSEEVQQEEPPELPKVELKLIEEEKPMETEKMESEDTQEKTVKKLEAVTFKY